LAREPWHDGEASPLTLTDKSHENGEKTGIEEKGGASDPYHEGSSDKVELGTSAGFGCGHNGDTGQGGTGALARRGRGGQHGTGAAELGHRHDERG
jgi:hypothetical protein